MIYYFKPFATDKNLGACYNRYMQLISDDDTAVLLDGDTCFLTPDYGMVIAEYVAKYPDAVLTCWTNRINEKAEQQWPDLRDVTDITVHMRVAAAQQIAPIHDVTALHGFISGFCLVVPKKVWNKIPFPEKQMFEDRGPHNLLGVDNFWTNTVRAAGVQVLRMNKIYIWHTYRLLKGDHDKTHLL